MVVLDTNILIRAVLGREVRRILDAYGSEGVRFLAPDVAFDDANKYLPALLKKRGKPDDSVVTSLEFLAEIIEPIDRDLYVEFEAEARERLRDRDEEDWPVLAIALALGCDIWTEDADFFGTGVATWTTSRIEILLKSLVKARNSRTKE